MSNDWKVFEPQDRAGLAAGEALMTFLNAHRNQPVRLSLRNQKRTDSRLVQLLLTATRSWAARDLGFDVADLPTRLAQDYVRLGLNGQNTGWSGLK